MIISDPTHDFDPANGPGVFDGQTAEIHRLQHEIKDLQVRLQTSKDHANSLQEHVNRLSGSLTSEVRERQAAEDKLNVLVQAITREKCDLEIMLQILIEQGDQTAEESEQARIDGLTQIANRRRFDEYLLVEWDRHYLNRQPFSLLLCDVDHFKLYNDHYGHQGGDDCLKTVAKAISSCFRPGDLVARYGGEEFAIVLPRTDCKMAVQGAERVRLAVEGTALAHAASQVSDRVTLSIGVASTTPRTHAADAQGLIAEADRNLYLAKHRGRNRVEFSERPEGSK